MNKIKNKKIEEKLLPLLKFFNKDHHITTEAQKEEYIRKLNEKLREIKECKNSSKIKCGYCIHYSVCRVREIMKDIWFIDINKIAWICKKFNREK